MVLKATGSVKIGDAQVVTSLPLPDTSKADVEITVPLENSGDAPVRNVDGLVRSNDGHEECDGGSGWKRGEADAGRFSQLTVQNPRLWWPNGYGKQELYTLNLTFAENGNTADVKHVRFGIREITYELSLFDETGHLRRVEFSPTKARSLNERVVNVTHAGMIETPSKDPIPEGFRTNTRSTSSGGWHRSCRARGFWC